MTRGRCGRKSQKPELHYSCTEGTVNKNPLASELTDQDKELNWVKRGERDELEEQRGPVHSKHGELGNDTSRVARFLSWKLRYLWNHKKYQSGKQQDWWCWEADSRSGGAVATLELLELQKQFETGLQGFTGSRGGGGKRSIKEWLYWNLPNRKARVYIHPFTSRLRKLTGLLCLRPSPDSPPRSIMVTFMSFTIKKR